MKLFFKNKKIGQGTKNKILVLSLFLFFVFALVAPITVRAVPTEETASIPSTIKTIWDKLTEQAKTLKTKVSSTILNRLVRNTLNRLAFDAANQLTTGGMGQEPLYITKSWGEYFKDIGDAAAGDFIDQLNDWGGMNMCEPNLDLKVNLGLGLTNAVRPAEPTCKVSTMIAAWDNEYQKWKDLSDKDFTQKFIGFWQPEQNDLSITLSLFEGMQQKIVEEKTNAKDEAVSKQGNLEPTNVGGGKETPPGAAQTNLEQAQAVQKESIGKFTGDALVDAMNVFLDQLAVNMFKNAMRQITEGVAGGPSGNIASNSFTNPDTDPSSTYAGSQVDAELRKILAPRFDSRGDYSILSDLATCPQYSSNGGDFVPAPTNCVIDDDFRQAVSEQKTVGEAVKEGFLHKDWRFTGLNQKADYNESYTYRSILILRKYRIIPLGWEEALYRIQENNSPATLMDLVSCFDIDDDYHDFSQGFTPNQEWCRGLIDPNWVLKAPLNYCQKQGPGYTIATEVMEGSETTPSEIFVTRADDYCADEQSCIKEKSDGSCEAYGYCTEEKRTWNFYQDSCEAVYNTCQTFKNQDTGSTVSYLENTLNYDNCNADSVGCHGYATSGYYGINNDQVNWVDTDLLYLNKNAESCSPEDEGCTRLIRIKEAYGHNFIINGDFENGFQNWPICDASPCSVEGYQSSRAIELSNPYNPINNLAIEVGPQAYNIAGKAFTFSFYAKDCSAGDTFSIVGGETEDLTDSDQWRYYRTTYIYPANQYLGNEVTIDVNSISCNIDKLKLEPGEVGTYYSEYGSNNIIHEKLIPEYLWQVCYNNPFSGNLDFSLKDDAPDVCSDYSRLCNANEVDCELYTNAEDATDQVAAKVSAQDYCPGECNNYDIYIQKASYFTSSQGQAFIPDTASTCSATNVGCSEFTNLDALSQGGESKEYYTNLRQCIKPNESQCASFYIWQGVNGGGYELKSFNLKADTNGEPAVTEDDSLLCNAAIYSLPPSHPEYNPDCYEFYNSSGETSYHLYSRTVTCSDDCHPYRMTEKNIEPNAITINECNALGTSATHWDASLSACYYCKNGGTWSNSHQACVYYAIPDQGTTCSASTSGCREYNGDSGNNIQIVKTYDFETDTSGWVGRCGDAALWSTEALNNGEHSLLFDNNGSMDTCGNITWLDSLLNSAKAANNNNRIETEVGSLVSTGSAYTLKFMAKASDDRNLEIYFQNSNDDASYFNILDNQNATSLVVSGNNEWNFYQISLDNLDHEVDASEVLVIESSGDLYLDDMILTEITDRYYLIKDSWQTPNVCYYDTADNYQGADYNLGCTLYIDRDSQAHYLRQFSQLCQDSAVGCQLMVDTQNSQSYASKIYHDTNNNGSCDNNETDCVYTPADDYIFAVYDPTKFCASADKGCQRLGQEINYGQSQLYSDVYLKNDPDKYDSILCTADTANCEVWSTPEGETVFFKDPGSQVCQWKTGGPNNEWGWYKSATNKCDTNSDGQVGEFDSACMSNTDCSINQNLFTQVNSCINNDHCAVTGNACTLNSDCPTLDGTCSDGNDCRLNVCNASSNCSLTGNACTNNNDCFNNNTCTNGQCFYSCEDSGADYPCPVNTMKTIGYGGLGNQVQQPDGWAGLCEAQASTCTEIIDLLSQFSVNLLINPTFEDVDSNGAPGDYWQTPNSAATYQNIDIIPNRLYVFGVEGLGSQSISTTIAPWLGCDSGNTLYELDENNNFLEPTSYIGVDSGGDGARHKLFMSTQATTCNIHRSMNAFNVDDKPEVILKEAIIDYQLAKNLDRNSCNGKVDLENGCVLFNERGQNNGSGLNPLIWNAYNSYYSSSQSPQVSADGYNNANSLVKVQPNRICGQWLACKTKIVNEDGETVCYDVADCDVLDKDGECSNFLETPNTTHDYIAANDKNASGYSVLDQYYVSNMREVGVNVPDAHFKFDDGLIWFAGLSNSGMAIIDEPLPTTPEKQFNVSYPAEGTAFLKVRADNVATTTSVIPVHRNQSYYINYLLNSSKLTTGAKATVSIYEVDNNDNASLIGSFSDRTSGWERKVYRFTPVNADSIKIELSTTDSIGGNSMYIDDINIEPVLQIDDVGGDNDKYVAKSCRLYPKQDSLSCQSTVESVISNGWQGYCLQKDPYYPDICLMWYPVDFISPQDNSTKDSGYQGKTPLYYCSEADANFSVAEIRTPGHWLSGDGVGSLTSSFCYFSGNFGQQRYNCSASGCNLGDSASGGCVQGNYITQGTFYYFANANQMANYETVYQTTLPNTAYVNASAHNWMCGNEDYVAVIKISGQCAHDNVISIAASCMPTGADFLTYENSINDISCNGDTDFPLQLDASGSGWYTYNNSFIFNEGNGNPNVFDELLKVYDFDTNSLVNFESYKIKCSQFEQVVKNDGTNQAWAVRTDINESIDTPAFFTNPYNYTLNGYGYVREDPPFGSAIVENGAFNNDFPIYFKNKNLVDTDPQDSYAGMPYGCSDYGTGNCFNVLGTCAGASNDMFCLNVEGSAEAWANTKQCPNGVKCEPLNLTDNNNGGMVSKDILKTMFLKSYASLAWLGNQWTSLSSPAPYNFSWDAMFPDYVIPPCNGDGSPSRPENNFCVVYPQIENMKLRKGDVYMEYNNGFIIGESGSYDLLFNSIIDEEQLPLGDIIIDWGDGSPVQTISNQDHKPDPNEPHVISHYYSNMTGQAAQIVVKIKDNWEFNKCCRGDGVCDYQPSGVCPINNVCSVFCQ